MMSDFFDSYVSQQLWQMMQMFLWGFVLMLSVQQKQALMQLGHWKYRQRMVGDFIFCMVWAVGLWLILMAVSGGLVRNYIIIGFLGGAVVYQLVCRSYLIRFCYGTARALLFVWRWFWRIVLAPWRVLRRIVIMPCMSWGNKITGRIFEKIAPKKQEFDTAEENIIGYEEIFRDEL